MRRSAVPFSSGTPGTRYSTHAASAASRVPVHGRSTITTETLTKAHNRLNAKGFRCLLINHARSAAPIPPAMPAMTIPCQSDP